MIVNSKKISAVALFIPSLLCAAQGADNPQTGKLQSALTAKQAYECLAVLAGAMDSQLSDEVQQRIERATGNFRPDLAFYLGLDQWVEYLPLRECKSDRTFYAPLYKQIWLQNLSRGHRQFYPAGQQPFESIYIGGQRFFRDKGLGPNFSAPTITASAGPVDPATLKSRSMLGRSE